MKVNKTYTVLLLHPDNHFSHVALETLKKIPNVTLFENSGIKDPDLVLSVCYPDRIIKGKREGAKLAALNIHTGLLPRHRGSNPLNWALIWGEKEIGVTLHYMTDTYDAGNVVLQKIVAIEDTDTVRDLQHKTKEILPTLIQEFFADPEGYLAKAWQQNQAHMTYAQKRRPEDSELNLHAPARDIYNLWRACDPDEYPAFVMENGQKRIVEQVSRDGTITYKQNP